LETGRPMLRATTNGISAIINSDGSILEKTNQFEIAILHSPIQAMQGSTGYSRYGNLLILVIIVIGLIITLLYGVWSLQYFDTTTKEITDE
jgi:apolipoprotein N-acyltransferase